MTQSQIVKTLADKCQVTKKISQQFLAALAQTAISEVKKNGLFVEYLRVGTARARRTQGPDRPGTRPPARLSRFPPRRVR